MSLAFNRKCSVEGTVGRGKPLLIGRASLNVVGALVEVGSCLSLFFLCGLLVAERRRRWMRPLKAAPAV